MATRIEPPERVRPRLERLRKALRHWQICSNEYEALRRELSTLSSKASREDILEVGTKFSGKLVDMKELKSLLGDELGIKRTVLQVIAEISHRIDYSQENVAKFEEQIEQGENEIDEDEEDEVDEYEEEDAKYKPTSEGLISPELQMELEEFRKKIKERGEIARAEEAKWITEDKKKPKKKRKGGVRFAAEPEEVSILVPEPLPLPTLAQATEDTTPVVEDQLVKGTNDKPESIKASSSKVTGVNSLMVEDDEDARLQFSIAEEERQSPRKVVSISATDPIVRNSTPSNISIGSTTPQSLKATIRETVSSLPFSSHTSPPSG